MNLRMRFGWLLLLLAVLMGCSRGEPIPATVTGTRAAQTETAPATPMLTTPVARDAGSPVSARVEDFLGRMTLEEKIGQMTQVEKGYIKPGDVTARFIGSVLSGGDGSPRPDDQGGWLKMVSEYQNAALKTRLAIPLIYGVDAVHGFGGLRGATLFPHNIGLGATRDPGLVQRIGRATAEEMAAVGIYWNFAPVVAVPQDIRWGRTYEGYSENTELVTPLGAAYVRGLQEGSPMVAATAKHFIGDGGTAWGTSRTNNYRLDQGDMQVDEETLRQKFLPPYRAAIDAGAKSVMVSFSSWNGVKMHAQKKLITDMLKGELGFKGFVVSDWAAINQVSNNYDEAIATSINAGLDMIMVPDKYPAFIDGLTRAVQTGRVSQSRIDDAVRRILTVKFEIGLFEQPFASGDAASIIGGAAHRQLAREAVRKSLVLLKNEGKTLPISKSTPQIFVTGAAANDLGIQSGGWTLAWQGTTGNVMPGTTILAGIEQAVGKAHVLYDANGNFPDGTVADVGIVVGGERPYAEGVGDREDLSISDADNASIDRVKEHSKKVVVVLVSGRPMVVATPLMKVDAFVAAWLPGTEGEGVADVLFGDYDFAGKLPYTWPRWNSQLPFANLAAATTKTCAAPLAPFGFGLTLRDESPPSLDCPKP